MFIFDLKLLIIFGIVAITLVAALSSFITYRASRKNCVVWDRDAYQIFDSAPFGVLLYSCSCGLLYKNQFVREVQSSMPSTLRVASKSETSEQIDPLQFDEEFGLLTDLQAAASSKDKRSPTQTTLTLTNGRTLVSWIVGHGGELATAYLLDLTQQRKADSEMRNFIGTLSHELRTPLTVMMSHLQIARSAEFAADTREASLVLVHEEIRHTSHLVQDMTLLASLQAAPPSEMRPIDVVLIADDALSRVALVAEERQIGIELTASTAIPRISGHPDRLLQVFINLLDNALKYCRTGDNVMLRLSSEPGYVLCEVQDTGPGIAAEHLPHLTQRMYRVRQDKQGFGLGLAIVEEILRSHQSRLEIESTVEGARTGTTMRFRLPTG